jgi:MoaA/NifB/PqqE/SkfB family radical SAM enzyme
MCYYWDNIINWRSRSHLEVDEIEKISSQMGPLQQLTISGGEPFLREELAEICTLFRMNCDVQSITIPTNGILTAKTETILTKALKDNPGVHFRIGLSLPEMGKELDDLYGVKNSFQQHQETFKMMKGLRSLYKNLSIDVTTVYNKYNKDRVQQIVDYVVKNMEGCNPQVSVVRGKPRLEDSKDISIEELEGVYTYVRDVVPKQNNRPLGNSINIMRDMVNEITIETLRNQKMVLPCKAGEKLAVIYDNGDVYPCELLENNFGNIRDYDYDIHRILDLQESKKVVKKIEDEKCHCTWECANYNNIVFSKKFSVELFSRYAKQKIGLYPPKTITDKKELDKAVI